MNADAELPDCFLQTGEDLEQIQTESDWRCCPRRCWPAAKKWKKSKLIENKIVNSFW